MLEYGCFFLIAMAWFLLFYFLPNGFFYWLFWVYKSDDWEARKIQKDRQPRPGQIRTEILRSLWGLTIYALIATFVYWCYRHGYSAIDLTRIGNGQVVISLLVLLVLHDTWFYWMHRLLHWRPLYRRYHRQHHESLAPTPWAAYSLSTVEAIVNCPLWVLCFTFPSHPMAILIVLFMQNIYDTFGHLGYEFFPRWMLRNKLICTVHATPTHHDAHHRYMLGNYGHYFNFWDRFMRTELKHYQPMLETAYEDCQALSTAPNSPEAGGALLGERPLTS